LPAFEWKTADNLEILPRNPEDVIDWFAARLGVTDQLNSNVSFVRAPGVNKAVKKPFPTPCLAKTALELYCDLCTAPAKANARRLAALASDDADRAFLKALLSDSETYQWLTGEKVQFSLREFFELFLPSAAVDLGTFLQVCPRQKSRPYTIASSSREDSKRIGVCVSMVLQDPLPSLAKIVEELAARGHAVPSATERLASAAHQGTKPRRFEGLTSTMLCTRSLINDKLMIYARASSFRLPRRTSTPVVMIGAGTGIAPFRGFVREFVAEGGVRPKTILFFGCTKSTEDYVYRDELQDAISANPTKPALKELVTAFSREQAHKIYVQHRLKDRAADVKQFIDEGGYVYVCGAVSMGKSIREELAAMLGSIAQVDRLQKEGRFVEELW
jgi:NADPH-ferrihemoprotein reductase